MTIRQRLTLQFSLIVGVMLVAFSMGIYFFSAIYRSQEFYTRLRNKAETAANLLLDKQVDHDLLLSITENSRDLLQEELIMIFDDQGKVRFQTKDSPLHDHCIRVAGLLAAGKESELKDVVDRRQFIAYRFRVQGGGFIVSAAAFDKFGYSKLGFLQNILISGCVILVVLMSFAGYFYARQALNPITGLNNQVREISANRLNLRVRTPNSKDELAELATEFNHMLDRLEEGFLLQKSFVSNASHELRTPLTSITGQISVALRQGNINPEGVAVLNSVYQDIRNLNSLANGLLELAQTSLDVREFTVAELRVDELLGLCQANIAKEFPQAEIVISTEEFPEDEHQLMVRGNADLLSSAFSNAIENGCKYSSPPRVEITLAFGKRSIEVRMLDRGIGIPAADLKYIFEPFYRAGNAVGIQGHGIGLALTKRIVEIHGGSIAIASKIGDSTELIITLPTLEGQSPEHPANQFSGD
jgi:signal transduction histidine kinase